MGEQVDLARQARGGLVERFFGCGVEERNRRTGKVVAMHEVPIVRGHRSRSLPMVGVSHSCLIETARVSRRTRR